MRSISYLFLILGIGITIFLLWGSAVTPTNESNNLHYDINIKPIYMNAQHYKVLDSTNEYTFISNPAYPSGKNYTRNVYLIEEAIKENKSVILHMQKMYMITYYVDGISSVTIVE